MRRWWTADLHLGHGNIIGYCARPFRDAEHMNTALVRNCNGRVRPDDVVVHLGDFCCKGRERGVEGPRTKALEWLMQLNGVWVMLEGNHDRNNGTKPAGQVLTGVVGPYRFVAQHKPLNIMGTSIAWQEYCRCVFDVCLCGHVHERWRAMTIDGLLHVNVGVDVNGYMPLDDSELVGIITKEKRNAKATRKV